MVSWITTSLIRAVVSHSRHIILLHVRTKVILYIIHFSGLYLINPNGLIKKVVGGGGRSLGMRLRNCIELESTYYVHID